jgi:hypothetical protein
MSFLKEIFITLGISPIFMLVMDLARIELATFQLKMLEHTRYLFKIGIATAFCIFLVSVGFVLLHVALFFLLPWELLSKAFVMLGLGLFYMFFGVGCIVWFSSRKIWFGNVRKSDTDDQFRINKFL